MTIAGRLEHMSTHLQALATELGTTAVRLEEIRTQFQTLAMELGTTTASRVDEETSSTTPSWKKFENWWQPAAALALCVVAASALWWHLPCLGYAAAGGVNAYVIFLLTALVLRKKGKARFLEFAHRGLFIIIAGFLAIALVLAFGSLYLGAGDIYRGCEPLATRLDAAYFSAVTITTLGFGDYAPQHAAGRTLVMWELASGALLLLVMLPVIASRLALLIKDE